MGMIWTINLKTLTMKIRRTILMLPSQIRPNKMIFILPQKQQSQIRKIRKLNSQLPYQRPLMQMLSACRPMAGLKSKVDGGPDDGLVRSISGSSRLSKSMARNGRKCKCMSALDQVLKLEAMPKNFLSNSRKNSKRWNSFLKTWTCTIY